MVYCILLDIFRDKKAILFCQLFIFNNLLNRLIHLISVITVDDLDSTIASPVCEIVASPLPEITLAVAEAHPFRTSRQYLELWRRNMIENDSDHALKFD